MKTTPIGQSAWTAADLAGMPDADHYELIVGELAAMTPGGEGHGTGSSYLHIIVGSHILANDLGRTFTAETVFHMASGPDTVLAPDFAVIVNDNCSTTISDKFSATAPDLVLETRSPGDCASEIKRKLNRWLSFAVKVVWDLDPKNAVLTAFYWDGAMRVFGLDDTLDCAPLLPGFSAPMQSVFPRWSLGWRFVPVTVDDQRTLCCAYG